MKYVSKCRIAHVGLNLLNAAASFVKASVFNKEKNLNNQYDDIDFSSVNYSINLDIFQSFSSEKDYNYKDFLPPEIHQNFQILYQTFLI